MNDDEGMTLEPTDGWVEYPNSPPALALGMRVETPYGEATITAHWPEIGAYGMWGVRYDGGAFGYFAPGDLDPRLS